MLPAGSKLRFRNDHRSPLMVYSFPSGVRLLGAMRRMRTCVVFFFVLLVLGLSAALPAEDVPTSAYDESEAQPYESNPSISSPMGQTASAIPTALSEIQAVQNEPRLQTATPFLRSVKPTTRADAHRFAGARSLLAQVCTLLVLV